MASAVVDFSEVTTEVGYFRAVPDGYGGSYLVWVPDDGMPSAEGRRSPDGHDFDPPPVVPPVFQAKQ